MSKTTAHVSSGLASSIHLPPTYTLAVVSINPLSGKSSLCKRLIDSNLDHYRLFLSKNHSIKTATWFYWGSVRHRRSDEKREGLFHLIEHSPIAIEENETYDNYTKRITSLTIRSEEKFSPQLDYPQTKAFPKEKFSIDAFLCLHDLSSTKQISDLLFFLHSLFKTRRPILLLTTKNDLIENQPDLAIQFEQSIRRSSSSDAQFLSNLPILHTSAHEHVNIHAVLELALYACDEPSLYSSRKSSHVNHSISKYLPSSYVDALKTEQSLKHVAQAEYKTLLTRHVLDFRVASWMKFSSQWEHHTSVRTFIDLFGKQQAERLYNEHIEELKRLSREKLIDQRLIPIIELLVTDHKTKSSRNWDYVRLQMQKHPRYSSTVIPSSMWSDVNLSNATESSSSLTIPEDLLDTPEARLRFESYINSRQLEQTRRGNCRSFFELLNRFANAGLVQYGHAYEKDCVYFLGRECYESLNAQDRLRVFAYHQTYLYRLICYKFVELLFESFEIFLQTFQKMNSAVNEQFQSENSIIMDEIFEKEILQQIKSDPRYQALNNRETDRHRLIMCHFHFLYDCVSRPTIKTRTRLMKIRQRSFERGRSSSQSLYNHQINLEEQFCPYTRQITANVEENQSIRKKKIEIDCPMEETCADYRINHEYFSKTTSMKDRKKSILLCGNEHDMNHCLRILSGFHFDLWTLNNLKKTQIIHGCLIVSENGREILEEFLSRTRYPLNLNNIPIVNAATNIPDRLTIEQLKPSVDELISSMEENLANAIQSDLRILLCFMCGGESNEIEQFFAQLSSRFTLIGNQYSGYSSFIIKTFLQRSTRKIEFVPVSFHSLFAVNLTDYDGFILFYDRDRKAALNTMTYLQKYISDILQTDLLKKPETNGDANGTIVTHPPVYVLCAIKDPSLSNIRKHFQPEFCVQCHSGTIRNFVESHLFPFLNQCWSEKTGHLIEQEDQRQQNEELLLGVTSYFNHHHANHSSTNDLINSNNEENAHNRRVHSLVLTSKSTQNSPRHHQSLLTPTNPDQMLLHRSYPYLSVSNNVIDSTLVPTTPVDPSITNLGLLSPTSLSTSSIYDDSQQAFKKSTSMRFAKLIEHPTDGSSYQSSVSNTNNENSLTSRRRPNEISPELTSPEEMKFHLYKHRTASHVKVPLATPEIIEFNESIATPFFIVQQTDDKSLVFTNNNTDDIQTINSLPSSPPTVHQQHQNHSNTRDESITDSSKQTRATDSSLDSSSDEHLQKQREASTIIPNPTSSAQPVTLQRKVSDRKSKRIRAKQNDVTGSASSNEILKKTGSDEEVLVDDHKRPPQQVQHPKKKRRPSFKRRKKASHDQGQTDSGIDSRMDSKDSHKASITPEPSSSSNVVISNEDDSSVGDYTKDSKNTSVEELEERPTANWIRRQLQHFAQARRDKNELKTRSPATTITSISPTMPSFKATMTSTPPNTNVSPLSSLENSHHPVPARLSLDRCILSKKSGIPLFIEKSIEFIEEYGLAVEGLYRVSGYKNQVELVISKLSEDPSYDLRLLEVPASAVATALKDMMRKLDEPLLSLELFDECENFTINQLREQNFIPLRKAFARIGELQYQTIKYLFKHLHFVSQHAASTHMDSSNLAVLWWPNLFQPQFRDLRTAEQTCQKAKPLIQAIIDNYSTIFTSLDTN